MLIKISHDKELMFDGEVFTMCQNNIDEIQLSIVEAQTLSYEIDQAIRRKKITYKIN